MKIRRPDRDPTFPSKEISIEEVRACLKAEGGWRENHQRLTIITPEETYSIDCWGGDEFLCSVSMLRGKLEITG